MTRDHDPQQHVMDRIPPQSVEAEQAALGAMLLEKEAILRALDAGLSADHFYREAHRTIYNGIVELYSRDEPVDLITLGELLKQRDQLERIGGSLYLTTCMSQVPAAAGILNYARIIKAKALQRAGIRLFDRLMGKMYDADEDPEQALREAEGKVLELVEHARPGAQYRSRFDILKDAIMRRIDADKAGVDTGWRCGIRTINCMVLPFQPGEMVVLAARPAMGKSSLAWQMAVTAADNGHVGCFFSLEMDEDMLALRDYETRGGNSWRANSLAYRLNHQDEVYGSGYVDENGVHHPSLGQVLFDSEHCPLYTYDSASVRLSDIRHTARQIQYDRGALDFIVIDYMQLIRPEPRHERDDVFTHIRNVSTGLKTLARELKCTVIAVSQLSRACEQRFPPRPQMSDLRESGQIEQDGDKILMLYRPGYYGERACEEAGLNPDDKQTTEILVVKQRNGETGRRSMRFDGARKWFCEPEEE